MMKSNLKYKFFILFICFFVICPLAEIYGVYLKENGTVGVWPEGEDDSLGIGGNASVPGFERTVIDVAQDHIYYYEDEGRYYTKEPKIDIYYEIPTPGNPSDYSVEVVIDSWANSDMSDLEEIARYRHNAGYGGITTREVSLATKDTSDPLNFRFTFFEVQGTLEIELDNGFVNSIVFDPYRPSTSIDENRKIFLTGEETETDDNYQIYGPIKFGFDDNMAMNGSENPISTYKINEDGSVSTCEIRLKTNPTYNSTSGLWEWEYWDPDDLELEVISDDVKEDNPFTIIQFNLWNNYLNPQSSYIVECNRGPWDRAGNLLQDESIEAINLSSADPSNPDPSDEYYSFDTDHTPPKFPEADAFSSPKTDGTEVDFNIYAPIKIAFDEMIDKQSFIDAFSVTPEIVYNKDEDISFKYDVVNNIHEIKITPKEPLIYSTTYKVKINQNFKDVAKIKYTGYEYDFTTVIDNVSPDVLQTFPVHNQTGLPHNTSIFVHFDEPIDESTITPENIQFLRAGNPIDYNFTYDKESSNLFIFPKNKLLPLTAYDIVITRNIKDLSGNPLKKETSIRFTTVENELNYATPTISFNSTGNILSADYCTGEIVLTFNKDMESTSVLNTNNYVLFDGEEVIPIEVSADPVSPDRIINIITKAGNYGFSKYPENKYFYINRTYTLYVLPTIKDKSGAYIQKSIIHSFKTVDTEKPYIVDSYPWGSPTDTQEVDISEKLDFIRIYFGEDIKFEASDIETEFYNTINDGTDFPISLKHTDILGNTTYPGFDAVYINEKEDNIDRDEDGKIEDIFLEIFNSSSDNINDRLEFSEGTYEILVDIAEEVKPYKITDIQGNYLKDSREIVFEIKNTYGVLDLYTDWFEASPFINDTAENKIKFGLKPEIKIAFKDKIVNKVSEFDPDVAKEAFYIAFDENNNNIYDLDERIYGDISYAEVSENEELKYVVNYTPEDYLDSDKAYTFVVESNPLLTNINGATLALDVTEEVYTWKNPVIISTFPENDTTEISINTSIILDFSEQIDTNTIVDTNIVLEDSFEVEISKNMYYDSLLKRLTIVPEKPLSPNRDYFVRLKRIFDGAEVFSVKDLDGNYLPSDFSLKFTTAPELDNTKPYILSTYPLAEAIDVPVLYDTFSVTFSENMDDDLLDGDGKTITNKDDPRFHLYYIEDEEKYYLDDKYLNIKYNSITNKAEFVFGEYSDLYEQGEFYYSKLRNNTYYYVQVDSTVQDKANNTLDNTGSFDVNDKSKFIFRFKTPSEGIYPIIENTEIENIYSNGEFIKSILLDFSETMYLNNIYNWKDHIKVEHSLDNIIYSELSQSEYIVNKYSVKKYDEISTPKYFKYITRLGISSLNSSLETGYYRITILNPDGHIQDTSGNSIVNNSNVIVQLIDDTKPAILSKFPEGAGHQIIKERTKVWVKFSENINHATALQPGYINSIINPDNFYVNDITSNVSKEVSAINYFENENGVDINQNGTTDDNFIAQLVFNTDLLNNNDYSVVVKNITDLDGNPDLIDNALWNFSTRSPLPPSIGNIELIKINNKVKNIIIKFATDAPIDVVRFNGNPSAFINVKKLNSELKIPYTYTWTDNNTVINIKLESELQINSTYNIFVSALLRDLDQKLFDGNKNGISEDSPVDDFIYSFKTDINLKLIELISTNPYNGKNDVDIVSGITLFFDSPVDTETFNYSIDGSIYMVKEESPEVLIGITSKFVNDNKTLILNPQESLTFGKSYKVIVKSGESGIRNIYGFNFDGDKDGVYENTPLDDFELKFSTGGDNIRPEFITAESSPADSELSFEIKNNIKLVFSEKLHDENLDSLKDFIKIYPFTNPESVKYAIDYDYTYYEQIIGSNTRFIVEIDPVFDLVNENYYTISISSGIKDENFNFLNSNIIYSFRTKDSDFDFAVFKNPANPDQLFTIARYDTHELNSLQLDVHQSNTSSEVFYLNKTNDSPYTYFGSFHISSTNLGLITVNASATDGTQDLYAGTICENGVINSSPKKLGDGLIQVSSLEEKNIITIYGTENTVDSQQIKNAPDNSTQSYINELNFINYWYSINSDNDQKIKFSSVLENDLPEKSGFYVFKDNKWNFVKKYTKDMIVELNSNYKYAVMKDNIAPRMNIDQIMYSNPVIKVDDASGISNIEVLIDNNIIRLEQLDETTYTMSKDDFNSLEFGNHDMQVKTIDNIGNQSIKKAPVFAPGVFGIEKIHTYPNPASDFLQIQYELGSVTTSYVSIKIYDVSGKTIYRTRGTTDQGQNIFIWDLKDIRNRYVANGVYYYVIKTVSSSGETIEKTGKIAILR